MTDSESKVKFRNKVLDLDSIRFLVWGFAVVICLGLHLSVSLSGRQFPLTSLGLCLSGLGKVLAGHRDLRGKGCVVPQNNEDGDLWSGFPAKWIARTGAGL